MTFPDRYRVLSWAPLAGGLVDARTVINHQVDTGEKSPPDPAASLGRVARQLGLAEPVVGLMTGVPMGRLVRQVVREQSFTLECFATVGLSNALAAGDPATYEERPGTINLIIACSRPLMSAAMVEATAVVTEAKVRALHTAGVGSTVSDAAATGTGTDCVAVACPPGAPAYQYCGKHTRLGELLGRLVYEAVTEGLKRVWNT